MFWKIAATLAVMTIASAGIAKEKPAPEPPALYAKLAACRTVGDATERLACFDKASAELDAAVAKNDVYMVDKQQVQKTRRTLFGLPLPDLGLFGGDKDDADKDAITELESTVKSASMGDGGWRITIEEGSTWQQTDNIPLALSPKPGMPVSIKKAALGSFKMSVRKQPPVRVRRVI
jgi:hypothetical protein